jgi:uncharacterized protein (DUF1330 family)
MGVYFMASIKVTNEREYRKYLDRADGIFSKYNGTYLAVDNGPEILEGRWPYSRAVLIRFATREEFEKWYLSDEYQEILQFRLSASECDTILFKEKSPSSIF